MNLSSKVKGMLFLLVMMTLFFPYEYFDTYFRYKLAVSRDYTYQGVVTAITSGSHTLSFGRHYSSVLIDDRDEENASYHYAECALECKSLKRGDAVTFYAADQKREEGQVFIKSEQPEVNRLRMTDPISVIFMIIYVAISVRLASRILSGKEI